MARARVARGVDAADLGSYQQAVRRVLTCDLITETRPRPGVLEQVLRWADELARDLRELFGYTLVATTQQVRLVRRLDALDPTQRSVFARKGKQFDRRRLAYLCLVLASFQRSRIEISLADLIRVFAPAAHGIEGLGFDPTVGGHKAAIVDVLGWLVDRGALRLSDGSLEAWARDTERGDALYDIDHDICAVLFRPARPVQHLTSAAGLLEDPPAAAGPADADADADADAEGDAEGDGDRTTAAGGTGGTGGASRAGGALGGRDAVLRRARRLLAERPVVYFADVEPEVADALRRPDLADDLVRLTGLVIERRAEGVMLADPSGVFTDRAFPGRGGAVSRTAGLLLAKLADLLEERTEPVTRLDAPAFADDHAELLARIDAGLPEAGVVSELAWTAPYRPRPEGTRLPFVEQSRLGVLIEELFEEFGATSFTAVWQQDPRGLLAAAVDFLTDLSLLRAVPGGVLVLPAALRYRNIRGALPRSAQGAQGAQLPLDLTGRPDPAVPGDLPVELSDEENEKAS